MSLSNYAENLLLKYLLTASSVTRPTAWYVSLHDADPGETGANEVTTGTDSDYIRQSLTFADPSSGTSLSNSSVSWTVNSGSGGYTVVGVAIWDALTTGNCLFSGLLPIPEALVASGVLSLSTGRIAAALD